MKIGRKTQEKSEISTASLPDIIFMLLIFFMVTTVMRDHQGLPIDFPQAEEIVKLKNKRDVAHLYVTRDGVIFIDDRGVNTDDLSSVMYSKIVNNPAITVFLKSDYDTKMEIITDIHSELREASALQLNYATKTKKRTK
tara:strand:+ start:167 stop:583 length:417 start_codon:yes stop_codon:yes gene_type:complete